MKGVFTRGEEFTATTTRHPIIMDYKTGVTKEGRILARQIRLVLDGGAYCSWSATTLGKACILSPGPYKIDNVLAEAFVVYTNKTMTGAMRGFGAPQVCFAYESQMDDIAKALGIDPLEIRLLNAFDEGSIEPDRTGAAQRGGQGIAAQGGRALRLGAALMKRRGRGIACMWYPIGFTVDANPSAATVKINEDGTATVLTGTVETGQGSLTVLGQIAAEALGIATDDVHVVSADTDTTPMDTGAIASRTTYVTGNAIWLAAEAAKAILFETAAPMLGVKAQPARGERPQDPGRRVFPQRNVAIGEVAHRAQVVLGQPPIGSASWNPPTVAMDPETGQGKPFAHLRLCHADRRGRRRRRDRRGRNPAHRRRARLRHRHQSDAGRGPGRGRHLDGRRHGAAGGDAVRRQRAPHQSQPDQLHHADLARHAGDRRSTSCRASIRPGRLAPRASASRPRSRPRPRY